MPIDGPLGADDGHILYYRSPFATMSVSEPSTIRISSNAVSVFATVPLT